MAYGNYGGSRSPALRNYLDQRQSQYQVGNRYGAAPGMPQAPTGGMGGGMAIPSAPAPIQPAGGRLPTPSYAPSGGVGTPSAGPPRGAAGMAGMIRTGGGSNPQSNLAQQVAGLPPEYQKMHNDYISSLYAGGDFEGRHEMAQMLSAQYAQLLSRMASQGAVDFSGSSQVADQFGNQREQMMNALAARGIAGSGVEAGALANSYGQQGKAMGQFYRDALESRRRENLAQQMEFDRYARGWQGQGLQKNWGEQADPGFWGDVAGVLGGVAGGVGGFLLGGPAGAAAGYNIGGNIGDRVGGNRPGGYMSDYPNFTGNPSMYGPQYPPVDWDAEYAWGGV